MFALCSSCSKTFGQPQLEVVACDDGITRKCPGCLNILDDTSVNRIVEVVRSRLEEKGLLDYAQSSSLSVIVTPLHEALRVICRKLTREADSSAFEKVPLLAEALTSSITNRLKKISQVSSSDRISGAEVSITLSFDKQFELYDQLFPDHPIRQSSTKKRKRDCRSRTYDPPDQILKSDVDAMFTRLKTSTSVELGHLRERMIQTFRTIELTISDSVRCSPKTFFLLGRYRKYARDVPQAEWMINGERKGRSSVEEIICSQVLATLCGAQNDSSVAAESAVSCRMHACGREDINVRCLGNGRPFVLEVKVDHAKGFPSTENLREIVRAINSKEGLNTQQDIDLLLLKQADISTWKTMQEIAEEKRKRYRCIVWTSAKLAQTDIEALNHLLPFPRDSGVTLSTNRSLVFSDKPTKNRCSDSTSAISLPNISHNENGEAFLQIIQKTPLRVLHRRPLLDRPRAIYAMHMTPLNAHYSILDLVTSAGTYVKEFVHGDCLRTRPSLGSVLGCQANILQLDVTWLYDEFEGSNGECAPELG